MTRWTFVGKVMSLLFNMLYSCHLFLISQLLACECPGVFGGGVGQQWPAAGFRVLSAAVHAWDLLKEMTIISITSTIVWPQVKQLGGNTAPPITRKLD